MVVHKNRILEKPADAAEAAAFMASYATVTPAVFTSAGNFTNSTELRIINLTLSRICGSAAIALVPSILSV